jgi:AcrR family transcriptional regulator
MQTRLPTEERQADIVAAALRLLQDSSPALVTTGDIAVAVGVTQGAVFKHFTTKDAIWVAAMRWVRQVLLQALAEAAEPTAKTGAGARAPRDALAAIFKAHVDFVIAHPGVPRLIFHELQQPADSATKQEVRALMQAYRELLQRVLGQAVTQGDAAPGLDTAAAATLFMGSVQGLVMQSMLAGKPGAMRSQAPGVLALVLRGLKGAA